MMGSHIASCHSPSSRHCWGSCEQRAMFSARGTPLACAGHSTCSLAEDRLEALGWAAAERPLVGCLQGTHSPELEESTVDSQDPGKQLLKWQLQAREIHWPGLSLSPHSRRPGDICTMLMHLGAHFLIHQANNNHNNHNCHHIQSVAQALLNMEWLTRFHPHDSIQSIRGSLPAGRATEGWAALDIVHPVRVEAGGSFLSYELWPRTLRKRDLSGHRDAPAFYQLQYHGHELRFNLTANPHLLAPGFVSKTRRRGGLGHVHIQAHSPACHLLGEVQDPELEGGLAAISACYGLVSALGRGYSGQSPTWLCTCSPSYLGG
ncbi:hypothetical protein P7K49_039384 [Saguinus oedipus]|uniref:Peptidase M12B propeptide domain-containing protein n=1 Tax=Saguinus oedipus TaxID=9490 RepID=A0ABQ9TBQ9_SAGOE|nr:hypothetical protein P7K49_039384 [Saguinus oedipus]